MSIRRTSAATTINRGVTAAAATPVNIITGSGGTGATVNISSIQIANSGFTALDDTAVSTAGGFLIINGTGFQSGASVRIQGTSANSVAFVSSSRLNVTVPAISSGTLDIYVINPDGSGAILISGFVSSGTPTWTTTSPLTGQDADVSFSIQLAATGDGTVTYAVSSGSTLPPGTALASNGVFSGTVTGLTEETTYTFSIDAIDNENQETARSFNITITSGDIYYNLTTLHLNGEVSGNSWITDASTNKFAVTVNGDTRPVAFSPYETVWSNLFDGTGDSLETSIPSAIGTSDFTFEAWVFRAGSTGGNDTILSINSSSGLYVQFYQTNFRVWVLGLSSSFIGYNGIVSGRWYHVAATRTGSTVRLFLDGTQRASGTSTGNITTTAAWIGGTGSETNTTNKWNGYISNARLLVGTSLYTSSFTPSTTPLTAVEGTTLLMCNSNRLIDNSTNSRTVTRYGDVKVSNFGPFTETDLITGSAYFDGTGTPVDHLSFNNNSTLAFGTGSFTIEFWINAPSNNNKFILGGRNAGSFIITTGGYNGTTTVGALRFVGSSEISSGSTVITDNLWHHVAIVRNGSTDVTVYVDGVSRGTGTDTTNYTQTTGSWIIARNDFGDSDGLTGYLSNFRIVKGAAVYTSGFTPPTSPLTAVANTSLLTLQNRFGENNNRFVDTSGINNLITRNGNATQGTFSPFSQNGWSGYFTGSSTSYISTPSTTILDQGQTYTVQCWIYPTSFTTSTSAVRRMYIFIKGVIYAGLSIHSDGTLGWYGWPTPGGIIVNSAAGTITTNAWQHVALVVNPGNYIKLFKNGVEVGSSSYTAAGADGSAIQIGHGDTGQSTDAFIGYISNFKITQSALTSGQLDYSAIPTISSNTGTSLLTLQTNRFNDTSANNLTITSGGTPAVQAFSPFKPTAEWSANTVGGSMYFDGTGDVVRTPASNDLSLGTGSFTVEFWVYHKSNSGTPAVIAIGSDAGGLVVRIVGGYYYNYFVGVGDVFSTGSNSGALIKLNAWTHIAWTRDGTSMKFFVNGTQVGSTVTSSSNHSSTGGAAAGGPSTSGTAFETFNGYISDFRAIKGTASYTSNFTPPTAPLTPIAGTTLLLNGTNGGIIDYTSRNNLETVGNVQLKNNIVKYGNNSLYFDGTGDYVVQPTNISYGFGTGDFTIEFWLYLNSTGLQSIYSNLTSAPSTNPHIYVSTTIRYYTAGADRIEGSALSAGQWYHVALSRASGSTKLFINGTQSGSTYTDSNNYGTTAPLGIGTYWDAGSPVTVNTLNGYIDDLRITKGYARYTSNFTPPTSAFKTK